MRKFSKIILLAIVFFSMNCVLAQDKEITRKEHLESLNDIYYTLNDALWNYISHVANKEDVKKYDKKRRDLIKLYFEKTKEIEKIGKYKGDDVIYNAIKIYTIECEKTITNDFNKLTEYQEGTDSSILQMENYLKEIYSATDKLNNTTQNYINVIKGYNNKYYSKEEYTIHKHARHEDMENRIVDILRVYDHFTPIYLDYLKSKKLEEDLYDSFDAKDTIKFKTLSNLLMKLTDESRYKLKQLPLYKDDTLLVFEFNKIMDFHVQEIQEIIPAMFKYDRKQEEFDKMKKEFLARDQSKLTPQDYDQMDLEVIKINDSNNEYNVLYNNYLDDRNAFLFHFNHSLNHFLSKHIVREH